MRILFAVIFVASTLLASVNSFLIQDTENVGKALFDKVCASCHTGGFKGWISGSPEIGEYDEWEPYFKDGLSVMVKHINEGTDKHEAKGECEDCTEEQIKAAIEYIMTETKNEDEK